MQAKCVREDTEQALILIPKQRIDIYLLSRTCHHVKFRLHFERELERIHITAQRSSGGEFFALLRQKFLTYIKYAHYAFGKTPADVFLVLRKICFAIRAFRVM